MYKAKFVGVSRDRNPREAWKHTELWYEYRGHEYCVVKDNNGYMGTPLAVQHREEQERIDREIEAQSKPIPEWKYEGSGQEGFDLFWKYMNGEEGEESDDN